MAKIFSWPFQPSPHDEFDALVRPHLQRLYKLAYRFTRQQDDAEDLVQDLLLKLFPRLDEMKEIEKISPWLGRILYRMYIDRYRSQQRSPLQLIDNEEAFYHDKEDQQPQPSEQLSSGQATDILQQALNQLNEDQRSLVVLHDVEGYTLQEISDLQDTALGTLKSRLNRARGKLRDILHKQGTFSHI